MLSINRINWGIIGCGDVTELKSGPAFNKVPNSSLVAVMRRNGDKAADYAKRHQVPRWYNDAEKLINDSEVNAIYIATPPDAHEAYTIAAIKAGKPVYVEKPMALNSKAAKNMFITAAEYNVKLVVAHYRREWPLFKKLKQLVDDKVISDIRLVRLVFDKPALTAQELAQEKTTWRVNPEIAGGGLFHDLAPHQLDIMYYLFGPSKTMHGFAINQAKSYAADDLVTGNILFSNGVAFSGTWCFNANTEADCCEIIGSEGSIRFSFFSGNSIELITNKETTTFNFDALQHVQQPMIEKTVQYFLGHGDNPCKGNEGALIMRWMERFANSR
ncbi:MAG: Gfo/Idh/MocA family oxidoreductase [Ferruginibacter sp.]